MPSIILTMAILILKMNCVVRFNSCKRFLGSVYYVLVIMKNINMTVKNPLGIIDLFPSEDAVVFKYVNLGFSNGM